MESKPPFGAHNKMLAGVVSDDKINFRFEVWAYRPLTRQELRMAYTVFQQGRDKRRTLRNRTVQMVSVIGS
jgi:hypothetical protein